MKDLCHLALPQYQSFFDTRWRNSIFASENRKMTCFMWWICSPTRVPRSLWMWSHTPSKCDYALLRRLWVFIYLCCPDDSLFPHEIQSCKFIFNLSVLIFIVFAKVPSSVHSMQNRGGTHCSTYRQQEVNFLHRWNSLLSSIQNAGILWDCPDWLWSCHATPDVGVKWPVQHHLQF